MATREQLHKQVDAVPDDQVERARLVIVPVADDSEPGQIIDVWGNLSELTDAAAADLMDSMAQEEAAGGHDPW
jgi:hypothetical protein